MNWPDAKSAFPRLSLASDYEHGRLAATPLKHRAQTRLGSLEIVFKRRNATRRHLPRGAGLGVLDDCFELLPTERTEYFPARPPPSVPNAHLSDHRSICGTNASDSYCRFVGTCE